MHDGPSEKNFALYAARCYDNPNCFDTEEFLDDLKKFSYVKRLLGRYRDTGEIKERLILNHLRVLYNVFGSNATGMLFCKMNDTYYPMLKPFLELMGYLPDLVYVGGEALYTKGIPTDATIVERLREI